MSDVDADPLPTKPAGIPEEQPTEPSPPSSDEPGSSAEEKGGAKSEETCCSKYCSIPPPKLLVLGCWVSFTSLTTYGMQDTILNIPAEVLQNVTEMSFREHYQERIGPQRERALWGAIVAALALGAVVGSMFAIPLADRFGRKNVLIYLANLVVLLGSAVMLTAHYWFAFELLILGRFILGVSIGISTTVLPMYLVEISPIAVRGFMASLHGVANNVAGAVGMILGLPMFLGNSNYWGLLLAFQGTFALLQICTGKWCPESPQYLYLSCKRENSALEIVATYDPDNVAALRRKWDRENRMATKLGSKLGCSGPLRQALILAALIGATRSFSGVTTWNTYSSNLLISEGASERWGQTLGLISQVVTVFTSLLNSFIIDHAGRRVCFLGGLLTTNLVWVLVFILGATENVLHHASWSEDIRLFSLEFVFSVVHPALSANCAWFLASELVPESVRARVQGFSMVCLWAVYLITSLVYPVMVLQLASYTILILFIIPSSFIWVYLFCYLPETSMKSVTDVFRQVAAGVDEEISVTESSSVDEKQGKEN